MKINKTQLIFSATLLWLAHFLVDLMIGIWPVYKTMAGLDLAKAGLIGGVCALAGEGMQIFFGTLSDRGYQKMLIAGGLIFTVASTFFAYTQDYWLVFFLFLLTCAGSGAFHPTAASQMGELNPERRGLFISIFASGGALGLALSQLIYTNSLSLFSGHASIIALPVLGAALFIYFFYQLRGKYPKPVSKGGFAVFGKFFRNRELRLLYFSQVCNATLMWGTMFLLPDVLCGRNYEPWLSYGGGHMMFILGGGFMMVPAGYLADKYSTKSVILIATITSSILYYYFLFSPNLSTVGILVILFFLGAALGVVAPISIALGTRLAPNHKGMVSAFLMGMVWCVSEGLGQSGGGILTKCFTHEPPAMALATIGGLFVLNIIAVLKLPSESEAIELDTPTVSIG